MPATLYLIPVTLGETDPDRVLPAYNRTVIASLSHFIVENVRTARRFLKRSNPDLSIDDLTFYTLNRHTTPQELSGFLAPMEAGESVGVISEAGCPAIADPGADVVAMAQQRGFRVEPLVGPSSILLSLMGSGFNGQSFAFLGYLPIDAGERTRAIRTMEHRIFAERQTQIFIETPYRNEKLLDELIRTVDPRCKLCVAVDLTCPGEQVETKPIREWRRVKPDLHKRPAIFLLYR